MLGSVQSPPLIPFDSRIQSRHLKIIRSKNNLSQPDVDGGELARLGDLPVPSLVPAHGHEAALVLAQDEPPQGLASVGADSLQHRPRAKLEYLEVARHYVPVPGAEGAGGARYCWTTRPGPTSIHPAGCWRGHH